MADPYVYEGTSVLKNRFGIRDADDLRELEYTTTRSQTKTMPDFPVTVAGFKAIHKHLFGPIYEWAGATRTVGMAKGASTFARAAYVDSSLNAEFSSLDRQNGLKGLGPDEFAQCAAHHISELNVIHP